MRETGGEIHLSTEPARILVEGGRAVGIETRAGEAVRAKHLVASSLNPHQTFLDLLDESLLPREMDSKHELRGDGRGHPLGGEVCPLPPFTGEG